MILFDENTWMCFCRDGGDGMCNLFQQTMHTIHEVLQISSCESVWYTVDLSWRFFFFMLKAGDTFTGKGIPTILPSLRLPKSFSFGVQLLGDESMPEIR